MKLLPLSEAKAGLSRVVGEVEAGDEPVTITRNGRGAAVLMSVDEFESWQETLAILSDDELAAEVRRGVAAIRRRHARLHRDDALDELFAD